MMRPPPHPEKRPAAREATRGTIGRRLLGVLVLSALAAAPASAETLAARALIKPRTQAVLSSEIAGRILRLPPREGDRFRSGDTLVEFDCGWFNAAQAAAQAGLDHAQAKLSGLASLAAMRSAGGMDVALARAEVERAKAELRTAGLSVRHCIVTAPFNGRVVDLRARAFESVAANTPLLSILDDGDLEASLVVPSSWLTWLKPGYPFDIDIDETGRRHAGRVSRLGASVDPVSQTVAVFGTIDDIGPTLVAGMSGTARVIPPGGPPDGPPAR